MPLSAILSEALYFFRHHLGQLALLTLPLILLQVGLQMWLGQEIRAMDQNAPQIQPVHIAVALLLLVSFALLIAALTLFMELRSAGHQPTVLQVWQHSLAFLPALMLAGVFSGMAIVAPVLLLQAFGPLSVLGFALSLYLFARLTYVNFMVVAERLSPLQAIKGSFLFSQRITGKTMLVLLLYIPILLLGNLLAKVALDAPLAIRIAIEGLSGFISLYINVALFRLYRVSR